MKIFSNNNMDDLKKQIHNLKQLKTKDNSKEINNRIKELTKSVNKLEKENKNINKKNTEKVQRIKKKSLIRNKKKAELFDILDSINDTNLKILKLTRKKRKDLRIKVP